MNKKLIIFLLILVSLLSFSPIAEAAEYTYDDLGRLTQVSYSDGSTIAYTYDAAGNILSVINNGVSVEELKEENQKDELDKVDQTDEEKKTDKTNKTGNSDKEVKEAVAKSQIVNKKKSRTKIAASTNKKQLKNNKTKVKNEKSDTLNKYKSNSKGEVQLVTIEEDSNQGEIGIEEDISNESETSSEIEENSGEVLEEAAEEVDLQGNANVKELEKISSGRTTILTVVLSIVGILGLGIAGFLYLKKVQNN